MLHNSSLEKINPFLPFKIVYVWVIVFIAILIYAMAWFVFGSVGMAFISAVDNAFTFDARWDTVVDIIKMVILWHPIISLFGWILWGILNSMKRDVRTWAVD